MAKLVEGAKKEGKLVWYTSTNVTESKPLLDDFEKQSWVSMFYFIIFDRLHRWKRPLAVPQ